MAQPTPAVTRSLDQDVDALVGGRHADPFSILGAHWDEAAGATVVRVFQPAAREVVLRVHHPIRFECRMERRHPGGLFEAVVPDGVRPEEIDYRLVTHFPSGVTTDRADPYHFGRVVTDFDLHLFGEGTHLEIYKKLGAHVMTIGQARGVHFAVWAPTAQRVSVVGDFNGWDGRVHPMRNLVPSGVWEIFIPDLDAGERYKFEIRTSAGQILLKADPFAFQAETPPQTASIVCHPEEYVWGDEEWMAERRKGHHWLDRPLSVYEVHLGSWRRVPEEGQRFLTYRELAEQLVPYVQAMGFTHIELLPVMEHPFLGSWGYQVTGYFAPTSRFGGPNDFRAFVDACHQAGIGVILDWVPGHFPKDAHGLARFDGTALYEHMDPRQGEQLDWGTLIFNYGRNEVRNFLLSNALYWLREFHVDGLRVDAVASMLYLDYSRREGEWIPNRYGGRENLEAVAFLQQMNVRTHEEFPGSITVAEESTSWPGVSRPVHLGGLGFTYKWNMGWMHDILSYMGRDPVYRRWAHNELTFSLLYAFSENFILPFSHDEVVHGKRSMLDKMPGDPWQKCASLRLLYAFMFGHPGKKLLFMGSEFGQWREWNHDTSLDWHLLAEAPHRGLQHLVRDLNSLYRQEPALYTLDFDPAGFQWIDCTDNENSVISFIRRTRDERDHLVIICNFTPVPRHGYRVGAPAAGRYVELLNTDASIYGGGDVGNGGSVATEPVAAHGFPQSLVLTLPPLGCLMLKPATG
ncbi:MAG TPA: 1,4-alpha-glucan branching protein GlgB [Vicinamibacterales bacterium]|nr:1,4-alpha-glucan branching protein GlgB [Vicinamibacterales bacterium]